MSDDILDTGVKPTDYFNKEQQWRNRNKTVNVPQMIGYFSVNEYREFVPDSSQLRYLKMPSWRNLPLDLNNGIQTFRPKPDSVKKEKMDFLLRFIANNINELRDKNSYKRLLNADIICSRGRLVQIMCPKAVEKTWSLIVSTFKGNIYICQPDGDDFHTIQTAYGFKFEQYLLSGNPLDDPITDVPVIESEEFYGVFKGRAGNLSLLYNAELDGLNSRVEVNLSETNLDELKFVELKTCLGSIGRRCCRWWAHSYLANISQIIVGYRNRDGIVTKIEDLSMDNISSQMKVNWSPYMCLDLLKTFLNRVHSLCQLEEDPQSVYKFDYDCKLNDTIKYTVFKGKNEYSFLPEWYINEMN